MITRIEIENFKSIQKADLELRPINVLIGANGAGKSNFINFFKLLNKIYEQQLQNYVAEQDGAENVLYNGLRNSQYLLSRIYFNNTNGYAFKLSSTEQNRLYFSAETIAFNKGETWHSESLGNGQEETKLDTKQSLIGKYVKKYLTSFKIFHFHDTSKTAKVKGISNINDNYFLREDAGNLASFLYFLQEKHPKSFKKIEMTVRSVAPFFERFDLKPNNINPESIRLEWKEKDSDMYLNASHLSDGTLRFIALTTLLLQPEPPSIIIIDEPELGLHPFAINKLAGLIQKVSAQSQVIVSTQSVGLVDNFEPEDIVVVDRKDRQSVFERQNSENLQRWLENYTIGDLWLKNVIGGRP
ncbi:MAG: ATPase [Bacteroidetes bacterium]|nr:MAG: ATPase [Bacteroidota bacterium]